VDILSIAKKFGGGGHPGACGCMMNRLPFLPNNSDLADAAEMLWVCLANVSGGDWEKQTPEWREAAEKWRDNYYRAIKESGLQRS